MAKAKKKVKEKVQPNYIIPATPGFAVLEYTGQHDLLREHPVLAWSCYMRAEPDDYCWGNAVPITFAIPGYAAPVDDSALALKQPDGSVLISTIARRFIAIPANGSRTCA